MRENKHTPEPMFQYQFRQLATYENGRTPVLLTEAQYCRAKSCIDACAGMTSEQVSHGIVSASVFSSVVQQRDELLAWRWRNELNARIGAAIQRACGELPDGYDIHVELEKGAGSVRLYFADSDAEIDDFSGDDMADYLHNAINVAIAHAEKGGAA